MKPLIRVFVAVTNDVSSDQRVHKVSCYLLSKGFKVMVYGRVLPSTFEVKRVYKIKRKQHIFNNSFLFYAEYNIRLLWFLLFNRFEIIYSNDLDTLPACFIASKIFKSKLVYDSHEFFTEVPELVGRRFVRKVWLIIENIFLPYVKNAITVSESIADEYQKKYGLKMEILRNIPSVDAFQIIEEVNFPTKNKVILYQGILNPGRGIKPVIDSLKFLKNVDLVIIGYGKVKDELVAYVIKSKMDKRVHFLGRIPHEKLANYTRLADIGMVLEEPLGKSFSFSLPNKLFDFIHNEVPVLASPLIEVKKIIEEYKVGLLIKNYNPEHIAERIVLLLEDKELRRNIKNNQKNSKKELCWENEIHVLDKFFL